MLQQSNFDHLYALILAGGSGVRFWPLSRELSPKQLLSIFGTGTLIAQAIRRVQPLLAGRSRALRVITNERLQDSLRYYLAEEGSPEIELLVEPVGRNTAPAIALAAASVLHDDPQAVLLVLPSDHVMEDGPGWQDLVTAAVALAEDGYLVTAGLAPRRPETGFGYIAGGEALGAYRVGAAVPQRAAGFIEKPDLPTAQRLIAGGNVYWNAGIFCFRADAMLHGLEQAGPEGMAIAGACRRIAAISAVVWSSDDRVRAEFAALPAISIDHALMEHADRVAVIPTTLNWDDVGSLMALETLAPPDEHGNIRLARGVDVDSHNVTVYDTDRLVATLGISDAVIVETADAALVCHKDRCQDIRRVVEALKVNGETREVTEPSTSLRAWGSWTTILRGEGYLIKAIEVHPGMITGMHHHTRRSENWVIVEGVAEVQRGNERLALQASESVHIPPGTSHALANPADGPLKIIEVQIGVELGEADTIRINP